MTLTDHRLAAILFADITGYSAMMQDNETTALNSLNRFREILESIIPLYDGHIIQYFGDGCLVCFESSINCVECAINLQEGFQLSPSIPVRIGLHMGDVLFTDDSAFGDGVNIASRIESLGTPGSILVSKSVRDHIRNKKSFKLSSMGTYCFKNIEEPIEVFAIANAGVTVPKKWQMNGKLHAPPKKHPAVKWVNGIVLVGLIAIISWFIEQNRTFTKSDKKSIAVLAFSDESEKHDHAYLSQGISESLINGLIRVPDLKVIGRTSAFSYSHLKRNHSAIAKELKVEHILDGSVVQKDDNITVNAELIQASNGTKLWSGSFEKNIQEIWQVEQEIMSAVLKELKVAGVPLKDPNYSMHNQQAYLYVLRGNYHIEKRDTESIKKALHFYKHALSIDSHSKDAWVGLARTHSWQASMNLAEPRTAYRKAEVTAYRALKLDPLQAEPYCVLGIVKMHNYDWLGAEADFQVAHSLEPGHADVWRMKSMLYRATGALDEALYCSNKAIESDPGKAIAWFNKGNVLYYSSEYKKAISSFKKALELDPGLPNVYSRMGLCYLMLKQTDKALFSFQHEKDALNRNKGIILVNVYLGRLNEADSLQYFFIRNYSANHAFSIAEISAWRKEKDKAFGWLEKAVMDKDPKLIMIKGDPLLKNLQRDPRYKMILLRLNLPED